MNDNVVQFPTANERAGIDERAQMRELVGVLMEASVVMTHTDCLIDDSDLDDIYELAIKYTQKCDAMFPDMFADPTDVGISVEEIEVEEDDE